MNIALVHRREWPSYSPSSCFSTFNANALSGKGISTSLIVGKGNDLSVDQNLIDFYNIYPNKNLNIFPINKHKKLFFSSSFPFYCASVSRVLKIHRITPLDAIFTRDAGFLPYLAYLKAKTGAKCFYETHNFFMSDATSGDTKSKKRTWEKYHKIEKEFIPKLDGIVSLISPQADLYKKYFPNQNVYFANPGITKIYPPIKNDFSKKVIGYIGDLSPRRDIDTLLIAVQKLKKFGVKLLIIGGKPREMNRINTMIKKLNIEETVELTGWISYKQLEKYLTKISVGIVPMKRTFYNQYLTAPMKIFDYYSRGIPVVAADLPSAREFVSEGENGLFYTPGNADDLAMKIEYLFQSEITLNEFSNRTYEKAKKMLWSGRAEKLTRIITQTQGKETEKESLIGISSVN